MRPIVKMRLWLPHSKLLPCAKRVRIKQVAQQAEKLHEKIDDALNVMSLNGVVIDNIVQNPHFQDTYTHSVHILQTDFSLASKCILLLKLVRGVSTTNTTTAGVNVAIYISLLSAVFFVSSQ
jgi:hypothetical protein